eukprot:1827129-Prymnesium_polylepis.1
MQCCGVTSVRRERRGYPRSTVMQKGTDSCGSRTGWVTRRSPRARPRGKPPDTTEPGACRLTFV